MSFTLSYIVSQLFNGLVWGIILGLMAVGLTIIFGMLNIINFAHGAIYVVGAYLGYSLIMVSPHLLNMITDGFWIAIVLVPVLVGLLGIAIEVFLLRPMYKRDIVHQLLLTFGLVLIIQEAVIIAWGSIPISFPTPKVLKGMVDLGFMSYPTYRLFVLILTPLVMLAIWLFLEKTKYGSIIRAGTEDVEMVNLLGINISRLFTLIFGLGASMAGFAGVLAGPIMGSLQVDLGNSVLLGSFVVVVLGGLGSFPGAILGAILVGITKAITTIFWAAGSNIIIFILMAVVLVVRSQGLLGKR